MYCDRCGTMINDNDRFCSSCGKEFPVNYNVENVHQNQCRYTYNDSGSPATGYLIAGAGILLKACLSGVLAITGKTTTSDAVSYVINVIFIICCVLGIISSISYKKKNNEPVLSSILIYGIILAAGLLFGKAIVLIIIAAVVLAILKLFSSVGSSMSSPVIVSTPSNENEDIESRRRKMFDNVRSTTHADTSDIEINRDGTYFRVGGGDWAKISKDGTHFEDSIGDWHNFS